MESELSFPHDASAMASKPATTKIMSLDPPFIAI